MSVIIITILILLSATISMLIFGLLLCYKYTPHNTYKKYLLGTLGFWILVLSFSLYHSFIANIGTGNLDQVELLNMRGLLLGIPCFLTIVSLPIVVLNAKLLKVANLIKVSLPIIIVVAIYFTYHLIAGSDPFHHYSGFEEISAGITTMPVILRILIHLCFLIYISISMYALNRAVPLYNQYIKDHIADSDYNVDWVSGMIKRIWMVTIFYFAMRFTSSIYTIIPYLFAVIAMFVYMIEMSIFHKMTEGVIPLFLYSPMRRGWQFFNDNEEPQPQVSATHQEQLSQGWELINNWMISERPYTNHEFTTQSVIENFKDITPSELTEIFKFHGESFQSIVREYRIAYACQIIEESGGSTSSKQLCSQVGFSHHSSFTRAFTAVMGSTPSEYIKTARELSRKAEAAAGTPPPRNTLQDRELEAYNPDQTHITSSQDSSFLHRDPPKKTKIKTEKTHRFCM